jgi:hypothetical protein
MRPDLALHQRRTKDGGWKKEDGRRLRIGVRKEERRWKKKDGWRRKGGGRFSHQGLRIAGAQAESSQRSKGKSQKAKPQTGVEVRLILNSYEQVFLLYQADFPTSRPLMAQQLTGAG